MSYAVWILKRVSWIPTKESDMSDYPSINERLKAVSQDLTCSPPVWPPAPTTRTAAPSGSPPQVTPMCYNINRSPLWKMKQIKIEIYNIMIHPNMLCPGCLMVNTTKCSDTSNMRPAASNITYHVKIILWTNRNINDSRITQTNIVILMDLAFLPKWGSASEAKEKPQFTLHLQFIYCISPGNEKQQILEFILLFSFGNKKHEWNSFQGSNKDQNI